MLDWLRILLGSPRPIDFSIDERQLTLARPGDLLIVTLRESVTPNDRKRYLDFVGQVAERHGIRVWILDGGTAVTVVRAEPQQGPR